MLLKSLNNETWRIFWFSEIRAREDEEDTKVIFIKFILFDQQTTNDGSQASNVLRLTSRRRLLRYVSGECDFLLPT